MTRANCYIQVKRKKNQFISVDKVGKNMPEEINVQDSSLVQNQDINSNKDA